MKCNGIIDLEEYGRLIASCYGETLSLEVRDFLKEKIGLRLATPRH
jgi:hypothetical protein